MAVLSSEIVVSSFSESSFMFLPKASTSRLPPPPYLALKSSCFIRSETSVSLLTGPVILPENHRDSAVPIRITASPESRKNLLAITALFSISSRAVRIRKNSPFSRVPQSSMYRLPDRTSITV